MRWLSNRAKCFWNRVLRLPRKAGIPIGLILVVGIVFGVYRFVLFWDYMENDPGFCQSCHIMEEPWDRWASSTHAEVGCHSCHHQSLLASAGQLCDFVFKSYEEIESHAEVEDASCQQCHQSGDPEWQQVTDTAGHKQHDMDRGIDCVTCHSNTLHIFTPSATDCLECHARNTIKVPDMTDVSCMTCHNFLTGGEETVPTRAVCLGCHQTMVSRVTWSNEAPMQRPCGDCHQPHEQAAPVVKCESCHDTVECYNPYEMSPDTHCWTCHMAHEWRITVP